MADQSLVAVLIDCDNISHRLIERILAEAATHGTISIRRAYGDWHSPYLNGWRTAVSRHAIQPIHQPAYVVGKNATDSAMIIDAMDLLYADNVGVFCLVASDSDYTRLAMRLRESARRVFGIGSRKAPDAFQKACDRYTWLELLEDGPAPGGIQTDADAGASAAAVAEIDPVVEQSAPIEDVLPPLEDVLIPAIAAKVDDSGWALLASVGYYIVGINSAFDSRAYGFAKLSTLARAQPFLEVMERPDHNGVPQTWVRAVADPDRDE